MWFANLFFSALLLAVSVNAETPMLHLRAVDHASIGLDKRQVSVGTGTVPPACTSICNPVNAEVNLGCPVTACCTTDFEMAYYDCLQCVGTSLNATNYATAQNNLNLLYTTCVDMGYVLPQLALPGQSASGSTTGVVTAPFPSSTGSTSKSAASGNVNRASVGTLIGATVLLGIVGLW